MGDIDKARMLISLARRDLATMLALKNADDITTTAFGFHGQQATEKALKAWLATLGADYPFTHSLEALFGLVEDAAGPDSITRFRDLDLLDPYAVEFRYLPHEETAEQLDKDGLIRDVNELLVHVSQVIGSEQ
jgi:HEPN domain-containing protein